jgi:quercetin dioxygenase-like cupin family protein
MAQVGQAIRGHDGLTLRIVTLDAGLLVMESSSGGTGGLPPVHFHPNQAERFEVLEGTVRAIVDGTERSYGSGESFEVPAGTPHTMVAEGPTRMLWEVRPALRTAEFFERLHGGGAADDPAAFLAEFSAEFRLVGPPPSDA